MGTHGQPDCRGSRARSRRSRSNLGPWPRTTCTSPNNEPADRVFIDHDPEVPSWSPHCPRINLKATLLKSLQPAVLVHGEHSLFSTCSFFLTSPRIHKTPSLRPTKPPIETAQNISAILTPSAPPICVRSHQSESQKSRVREAASDRLTAFLGP